MDSITAFAIGEANRGKEVMVFDWDKAALIIKEGKFTHASAGLHNDWEWTGGKILVDGRPVSANESYTYLSSTWATPELEVGGKVIDCYRMKSEVPGWDAHTLWPESALKILNS